MRILRAAILAITVFSSLAPSVSAQDACPCVPVTYLWTVKTCPTWTCAAAELINAAGDTAVFTLPVRSEDLRWLVLRRIVAGSAIASPTEPFALEQFDDVAIASLRYSAIDADHLPLLVTTSDGRFLVASQKQSEQERRRSVRR